MSLLPHACPWCARLLQRTADPTQRIEWHRGDLIVCIRCAGVSVVTASIKLRCAHPPEVTTIRTKDRGVAAELDRLITGVHRLNALEVVPAMGATA